VQFYFCDPHHPWQKPTVENTNGLLREFFPKGTDFGKVTDEEVQHAVDLINGRPRKVLKYRTANEVYREMLHSA
jgi:IS30 family transposase